MDAFRRRAFLEQFAWLDRQIVKETNPTEMRVRRIDKNLLLHHPAQDPAGSEYEDVYLVTGHGDYFYVPPDETILSRIEEVGELPIAIVVVEWFREYPPLDRPEERVLTVYLPKEDIQKALERARWEAEQQVAKEVEAA